LVATSSGRDRLALEERTGPDVERAHPPLRRPGACCPLGLALRLRLRLRSRLRPRLALRVEAALT